MVVATIVFCLRAIIRRVPGVHAAVQLAHCFMRLTFMDLRVRK